MRAAIVGDRASSRACTRCALQAIGVEVVAVCGIDARRRAGVRQIGAARTTTSASCSSASTVDVLHVCTPNDVHAAQALAATRARRPRRLREAARRLTDESRAMVEAAEASRASWTRPATTCAATRSSSRCGSTVESGDARARSRSSTGGTSATTCSSRPRGWRIDPARSGPSYVVGDLGTHWLDLAEHVTGLQVTEVLAEFRSFAGGPLEDYAALLLRLDGGVAGSLVLSAGAAGRKNQLLFECEGSAPASPGTRSRRPRCCSARRRARRRSSSRTRRRTPSRRAALARYPAGHGEGYGEAFRTSSRRLRARSTGEPHGPFPTFADGHRGVATVEAAVRSARDGGWVRRRRARPWPRRGPAAEPRAAHEPGQHERERDQHQRRGEQQRRERVHLGRDPELHLRVDVDRQRVVAADQEQRDDELVEREREREQRAREDGRRDQRQDDVAQPR